MNKEELEKEFEKYLKDSSDYYDPREPLTERKLLQMWLDCAEPREKRIANLEAENEQIKNSDTLCKLIGEQKRKITDLEAQNKEQALKISRLESDCDAYSYSQQTYQEKINELEQQIEKMKNWCNCKNYQECLIELAEQGKGMKPSECCVNCKKWEIEDYIVRKKKQRR